jgi:hypothetical protein
MDIASLTKNALVICHCSVFIFCGWWWFKVANILKLMILSHGGKIGAFYWDIDF